jgi:NADH dehydrogenase/NADH:ubiquinone oxidoreductase subunit G
MPRPEPKLITFEIDGREVTAPAGEMLVDAAKRGDVEIPIFCYEPKLGQPVGACRMCLVEVEGIPKLQTGCSTAVRDGMVVTTKSERVVQAQNAIVEFLLVNHPLDCPVCDKGGECPLQDISYGWGAGRSRMVEPKRHFKKPLELSPLVAIDRERCILCFRCVRFSQEISEDYQLVFTERGSQTYVGTHDGHPYVGPFSGNIIELCPVGALTSTAYRFRARPWDIEGAGSVCTLCPSQCNVEFTVRDDEKVLRVLARDHPEVDDGWLCDKGRFGYQAIHAPERLRAPMVRDGGMLREVPWERALGEAASALERAGERTAAIVGGETTNEEGFLLQRFLREGLGSHSIDSRTGGLTDPEQARALARPDLSATVSDLDWAGAVLVLETELIEESPILDLRVRKAARRNGVKVVAAMSRPGALDPNAHAVLRFAPGAAEAALGALVEALGEDPQLVARSGGGTATGAEPVDEGGFPDQGPAYAAAGHEREAAAGPGARGPSAAAGTPAAGAMPPSGSVVGPGDLPAGAAAAPGEEDEDDGGLRGLVSRAVGAVENVLGVDLPGGSDAEGEGGPDGEPGAAGPRAEGARPAAAARHTASGVQYPLLGPPAPPAQETDPEPAERLEMLARRAGADPAAVRAVAALLKAAGPVVVVWGERIGHGDRGAQGVGALLALARDLDLAGTAGAGLLEVPQGTNARGLREVGCAPNLLPGLVPSDAPGRSAREIAEAAGTDVTALVLLHADPLRTHPEREAWEHALERATAVVAFTDFLTPQLEEHATVVFPAASYAEREGTVTHPDGRIQRVRQAIGHPDEVRAAWSVLADIAARVGAGGDPPLAVPLVTAEMAAAVPIYAGLTLEEVGGRGVRWPEREAAAALARVELPSGPLPDPPEPPSGMRLGTVPSLWAGRETEHAPALRFLAPRQRAELSAVDARRLGIAPGDAVAVRVDGSRVRAVAALRERQAPGTVFLVEGTEEENVTALLNGAPQVVSVAKA